MVLGVGLRLFRLGQWSFWPDEIFSFGTRSDGFNNSILLRSLATDLIGLTVRTLGPSEWNARLVPALIGMATIPLLYLLLRRCLPFPGALFTILLLAAVAVASVLVAECPILHVAVPLLQPGAAVFLPGNRGGQAVVPGGGIGAVWAGGARAARGAARDAGAGRLPAAAGACCGSSARAA